MLRVNEIYKFSENHTILKDISFNFKSGEIYSIVGKNGAGKSTFLRVLAGLIKVDQGEIVKKNNLRLTYMSDEPFFYEELSGNEFLEFNKGLLKNNIDKKVLSYLIQGLNMTNYLNDRIVTYSYGMKKKLNFLIGAMSDPDLYLIDESFNGIDDLSLQFIIKFIQSKRLDGSTFIISSHQKEFIHSISTCIINMDNGSFVMSQNNNKTD